ncbi:TetR family transcriptional regulator [soil metagenome]
MLLRNEPVQARSTARLASLLDAAASVVDEIGYERLTTALVAERAGASIGTVYRYFPDRIAVLQGLSARFLGVSLDTIRATLIDEANDSWAKAFRSVIDDLVESFRTVPGFRSLRFGDVLDLRPTTLADSGVCTVAKVIASALSDRFGLDAGETLEFRITVTLDLADALLNRAFETDADGDQRYIDEAHTLVRNYLTGFYSNENAT